MTPKPADADDTLWDRLQPDGTFSTEDLRDPLVSSYVALARMTEPLRLAVRRAAQESQSGEEIPDENAAKPQIPGYRLLDELGSGGFGVAYLACRQGSGETVVIKMLKTIAEGIPGAKERFLRERRALMTLDHPNIIRYLDGGETEKGESWLALEYANGGDLREFLQRTRGKPWDWRAAANAIMGLALTLAYAHHMGFVHRDLKPGNILLNLPNGPTPVPPEGGLPMGVVLKIADFGLVRILRGVDETDSLSPITDLGAMGTPLYMAPEQALGHAKVADARADIWSLGAILHELLTGRSPLAGKTYPAVMVELASDRDFPSPRTVREDLPEGIAAVCRKTLRKNPNYRYAQVADLVNDLALALEGGTPKALGEATSFASNESTPIEDTPPYHPAPEPPRRHLRTLIGIALVIGMCIAIVGYAIRDRTPTTTNGEPDSENRPTPMTTAPVLRPPAILALIRADLDAGKATPEPGLRRLYLHAPHLEGTQPEAVREDYRRAIAALAEHLKPLGRPLLRPINESATLFALDASPQTIKELQFGRGHPYGLLFAEREDCRLQEDVIRRFTERPVYLRLDWFIRDVCARLGRGEEVFGAKAAAPKVVRDWADRWAERSLDVNDVARELDETPERIRLAIRADDSLTKRYGLGPLLVDGGTISRAVWESLENSTSAYQEIAGGLKIGSPISSD